jgi:hypothetical protein
MDLKIVDLTNVTTGFATDYFLHIGLIDPTKFFYTKSGVSHAITKAETVNIGAAGAFRGRLQIQVEGRVHPEGLIFIPPFLVELRGASGAICGGGIIEVPNR